MAKKKRKKQTLQDSAETFALSLLYEASGGKLGKGTLSEKGEENQLSFRDRRALLDSVTKLLGAQRDPEEDENTGVNALREKLRDGNSGADDGGTDTDESFIEA